MSTVRYIVVEKNVGETPLQALEHMRRERNIASDIPLAYAGRLDPLASGKLLVLIGDECKHQEKYHNLDKEYEVAVLLSFSSDTGDVLGLAEYDENIFTKERTEILQTLTTFMGTRDIPYPHYSSKTVQGKPLFLWTLEGRLDEIEIPTTKTTIHALSLVTMTSITKTELEKNIRESIESIPVVTGESKRLGEDFRRGKIRARWREIFEIIPEHQRFTVLHIRATTGAGAYMRTLAGEIGRALGTSGLALSIYRTTIGRYIPTPLLRPFLYGIWTKKF